MSPSTLNFMQFDVNLMLSIVKLRQQLAIYDEDKDEAEAKAEAQALAKKPLQDDFLIQNTSLSAQKAPAGRLSG